MIVDKQEVFRVGMRQILSQQADFNILDFDPEDAHTETIETNTPDVLLLDTGFPTDSGLKMGREILRRHPGIRVIMLSPNPDNEEIFEAIKIGAVAYLPKNTPAAELTNTISKASRGEYPINESLLARPEVAQRVLRQFQDTVAMGKTMEAITAPLTSRETQILSFIANGNSNKQIALKLEISEQTIKNHVSSILRKLNANDRAHAVVLAIRQGLIPLEEQL